MQNQPHLTSQKLLRDFKGIISLSGNENSELKDTKFIESKH